MKTRVFIPVLVAAAAGALQAQQSGGRQMLQMDGIVAVVGSKPILWSEVQEQLLQERPAAPSCLTTPPGRCSSRARSSSR